MILRFHSNRTFIPQLHIYAKCITQQLSNGSNVIATRPPKLPIQFPMVWGMKILDLDTLENMVHVK